MFEKEIIIKGPYRLVHLEKVNPRELFDLVMANKEYLSPWMPWVEFTNSVNDTENFIKETTEMIEKDKIPHYGIYHNSQIIGMIGLNKKDNLNCSANAGYWISSEFQGRGIVPAALRIILTISFSQTDLNRIELSAATGNIKSQRVALKCGFTQEGIKRESEKINNRFIDHYLFSFLRREWVI